VLAEAHVICALRDKRSELAGTVNRLEQELLERRANLTHLDATMRLFDPDLRPDPGGCGTAMPGSGPVNACG
jgi:hypothetical protein